MIRDDDEPDGTHDYDANPSNGLEEGPGQDDLARERPPTTADDMATRTPQASIRGSTETMRMILLTISAIGVTFTWGVEMTYCTPYLLNLGLSKSRTSLVWIAGPLSGLIVQPVVGAISDGSTSRWGRRRPLLVLGTVVVAISLLVLGFTREIVGLFEPDGEKAKWPTIALAVLAIYAVDFAINVVMSCSRSLVVDTLPIDKQQAGAAWVGRLSAIGNLMGYVAGAVDLVETFGTTLGDTQFKQLTILAVIAMVSTNAITCWAVSEKVHSARPSSKNEGRFQVVRQIYSTVRHLPPRIQAICWAQFWSWIGWFPFLFYSTTWIGETYYRYDAPQDAKSSGDSLGDIGRIGSTSLVIYSCITFVGAFVLPLLIKSPEDKGYTPRPPPALAGFLKRAHEMKPDLLTAWMVGHLMFSASMLLAPFATSFRFATVLVSVCGIPWTLAGWAPVAFLGIEVNKLSSGAGDARYSRLPASADDTELSIMGSASEGHTGRARLDADADEADSTGSSAELSGIYFGILNIYTTLPQFIGTFISTIVFSILEPGKSPELAEDAKPQDTSGPNAISICLFIGAVSTLYAAVATRKLKHL